MEQGSLSSERGMVPCHKALDRGNVSEEEVDDEDICHPSLSW